MKDYSTFINEISAFRQKFRENEIRYPGVQMFMTIATRYLNRPEKLKDSKLVRLLKRLRIRGDINNFTKGDFSRVYKFVRANNLNDVDRVRTYFQNAKDGIDNNTIEPVYDEEENVK